MEPDRVCPTAQPFPGSPCEGTLRCEYTGGVGTCVAGEWTWETLCDGGTPGGGCAPPLVESCPVPFTGSLPGATVEVGPDAPGAFRPFAPGEHVTAIIGAQGGAMVAYRLRVSAPSGTPTCLATTTRLTYDGMAPDPLTSTVELHCGQTLRIYQILPSCPGLMREYPVTLDIDVTGAGTISTALVLDGGRCPRGG